MAKGKTKINSSEDLAPPQVWSLRSRKRECPSDNISVTDDVQAPYQQDTEENNRAVVSAPLQCLQSPVQECAMIKNQQDQATEHPCVTKQEKYAEYFANVALTEQEVTNPQNDSQWEGFQVLIENDTNKGGTNEEEIAADECNRSPYQTCTDQLQVFSPSTEGGDKSCATALDATEHSNLERNQQTGPEEPINVCIGDVKEIAKESAAGLPAKKKRRMGMCGLTEKERSHFLLTQKRENGQNGNVRAEKTICDNTAEPVTLGGNIFSLPLPSSPPSIPEEGQNVELSEEELHLQSSHCEADERAETKVHASATLSAICDPGCTEGKGCESEGGIVTGPEQTGNPEQLAEKEAGDHLGSQTLQELKARTTAVTAEIPKQQEGDGSVEANCSSAISFCTSQDDKSDNRDAVETSLLQVNSVIGGRDEKKEEIASDMVGCDGAEEGASSTVTQPGKFNHSSVELCEATVTPSVSERKGSCDPDEPAAGPSAMNAEHTQTLETADSFGSGCLDYVSDSQLNTIILIEEEVMQKEEPDSSDCHEDATDLICGLIRELSSLNRKVMATHRELESLRRSSKSSRNSIR